MKAKGPPTEAELRIFQVLWKKGAATVREVHEEIEPVRPVGYTTVLKLLQIMHEKGLVARDDTDRAHRYRAVVSEDQARRQTTADLLNRVFGGSAAALVQQALALEPTSAEDLREIRSLLDRLERGEAP